MFWLAKLGYSALATAIIGGGVASGVGIAKQFSKRQGDIATNSANITTPKAEKDRSTLSLGTESDGHSASLITSSLKSSPSSSSPDSSLSVSPQDPASIVPTPSSKDPIRDPAPTSSALPISGPSSDSPTDLRDENQVTSGENSRDPSSGDSEPSEASLPAESPRELTVQSSDRDPHLETELPRNEEQHNDSRDEQETELKAEVEDSAQRKEDEEEKVTIQEEEEVVEETVVQVETGNCKIIDPLEGILELEGQEEGDYYSVFCNNKGIGGVQDESIPDKWEGLFPRTLFKTQDWTKDRQLEIKAVSEMFGASSVSEEEMEGQDIEEEYPHKIRFVSHQFVNTENSEIIGHWDYSDFEDNGSGATVKLVNPPSEKNIYLVFQ